MDPYYGEIKCCSVYKSGKNKNKQCKNGAYWKVDGLKYVCGVHSGRYKNKRVQLKKNPEKAKKTMLFMNEMRDKARIYAEKNKKNGIRGDVICTKLKMMRKPEYVEGYISVFPNYKHQNRKDGIGSKALSPKAMGPIETPASKCGILPISKNLENFHQGNKVFKSELGDDGNPSNEFFMTQKTMYNDPIPHRHKTTAFENKKNKNIPVYSVWTRENGDIMKLTYLESRQFYCNYYERIARELDEFKNLVKMLEDGYNLQIHGYDAYNVEEDIETCYLDTSRPFGHELVLYTLLTHEEKDYPWRKYKTEEF